MAIGTLDAIHLATALLWRDRLGPLPEMATHDSALGTAARVYGFEVRGVCPLDKGLRALVIVNPQLPTLTATRKA